MRHSPRPVHRCNRGFTLVEQVASVAIVAILIALAVPTMANLVARTAIGSTQDALFVAARLARTTAITHNTHGLLCPSTDGRRCSASADWQQGWIVGVDRDGDGQPDRGALDSGTPDPHVRVVGTHGRRYVRFRFDGDAAGTNITLLVCPQHGSSGSAAVVIVSNVGRIREQRATTAQRARCPRHA